MNYNELYEYIYSNSDGIGARIAALDPATKKAWLMLDVLNGRKGFDHWWHEIGAGIRDEIFEQIVSEAGQP